MSFTVVTDGRLLPENHRCIPPGSSYAADDPPLYFVLPPGSVIKCDHCGQHWQRIEGDFTKKDTYTIPELWVKVAASEQSLIDTPIVEWPIGPFDRVRDTVRDSVGTVVFTALRRDEMTGDPIPYAYTRLDVEDTKLWLPLYQLEKIDG